MPYVDTLIDLQERYGVNAAWIVAQGCLETGGGTQGSGVTNNNWYGLGYDGVSSYYSYDTPEECFEDMARTFKENAPLFIMELQSGWYDKWLGYGYDYIREDMGASHINIMTKTALSQGVTIFNHYMCIVYTYSKYS